MPSPITHAAVAVGGALIAGQVVPRMPARFWPLAIGCAVAADCDVLFGGPGATFGSAWDHRGLTHSLAAAALLAGVATMLLAMARTLTARQLFFGATILVLVAASHPLLDAMTDGQGVALFWPIFNERMHLNFRPLANMTVELDGAFSDRAVRVALAELTWVWLPVFSLVALTHLAVQLAAAAARRQAHARRRRRPMVASGTS
jgi:inner membrane protein